MIFLASGVLLACVSISVAALTGWQRGATLAEAGIWTSAGIGLALTAAVAPTIIMATTGARRFAAVVAYVLALSFVVAASLGSQHAGRTAAAASTDERARLESAYRDARAALDGLPATRPVAAIEADLRPLLARPDLASCDGWLASKALRTLCIERVIPLKGELANAREREKQTAAMTTASEALSTLKAEKPANGDAAAIGRYLALAGVDVAADRVADALNALTVAAVEIVAGLALMLGRGPDARSTVPVQVVQGGPNGGPRWSTEPPPTAPESPSLLVVQGGPSDVIIKRLQGGPVRAGQRDLAALFDLPKTSFRREVDRLVDQGVVRMESDRSGTKLELVG